MEILREAFDGEIWLVIPVDPDRPELPENWLELSDHADGLLFDTRVQGETGGTGRTFAWDKAAPLISQVSSQIRVILAGGLSASNVGEAIATVRPGIVDVSSGVELSPGVKDHSLMRAFAEAVHSASIV